MLPGTARIRRGAEYAEVVRHGRRAGSRTVVVHRLGRPGPARVGFVVGRQVGPAVCRNRVKRRLRHLIRPMLAELSDSLVVVRALPESARATSARLAEDLARVLAKTRPEQGGPG